jgi:hypothetical protein
MPLLVVSLQNFFLVDIQVTIAEKIQLPSIIMAMDPYNQPMKAPELLALTVQTGELRCHYVRTLTPQGIPYKISTDQIKSTGMLTILPNISLGFPLCP